MEWKLIEQKWHEMALRLQVVAPAKRHAQSSSEASDSVVVPPVTTPVTTPENQNSDARAMA